MKTLNITELEDKIKNMPGVKVTKPFMEKRIVAVDYQQLPKTTVIICNITLDNGFSVRGESACVDPNNFNEDIGRTLAYNKAFDKLWPFFGFLLSEMMHIASKDKEDTTLTVAKICHEVNKAYCEALGDKSQPSWDEAEDWQKSSALNGVKMHMLNPNAGPEASHENWMEEKVSSGWIYGDVKDPEKKTHPCIKPFGELSTEQKAKDYIFRAIVHSCLKVGT